MRGEGGPSGLSISELSVFGFYQSFYRDGRRFNEHFRQIVSSSRMVINFLLAGKLLGSDRLLEIGKHGLDYIENVHYDRDSGRYAFAIQRQKPSDMTQQAYGYAFILAAHAAARLTGMSGNDDGVEKVFDILESKFWLPDKGCYLDTISADGVVDNSYRGQNSNMHLCEALIAAYEATKSKKYLDRAELLALTFTQTLASKGGGFVYEHFTVDFEVDWEYNKHDPTNIYRPWGFQPGHQMEWVKNLLNIHRHAQQPWMLQRAQELFVGAWEASYDAEHGGLVYGFGPDKAWCDSEKYFWVQGESMAAAALLYGATGEAAHLEKYLNLWQYIWRHWVDHEYGGWVCFKMTRDNQRLSDEKAVAGAKCDYHSLASCVEALRAFGPVF
mmetsp:Transcript_3842/g.10820  ORF Transcript_3842/g.10820 Transcript_3842/m.10820 type:complete len:385 (-) Transcript_3842:60-1214(-)